MVALCLELLVLTEVGSGFSAAGIPDPGVLAVFITRRYVGACRLLRLDDCEGLLVSLLSRLGNRDFDLYLLELLVRVLQNASLQLVGDLGHELFTILFQLHLPFTHQLSHLVGEGVLSTRQVLLGGELLGVAILHGLLDLLEFLLAVLGAVLLHLEFLVFFDGARPNLHIVDLLGLGELERLAVLLQNVGVEGHDRFVIEFLHGVLKILDSVFADGLDAANAQLPEHLIRTLLLLLFESVERGIDLTHVVVLDLLCFEGGDAVGLLLRPQLLDLPNLRLVVLLQLDLRLLDVILVLPLQSSLLVKLGLDFSENTVAFIRWSVHILHLLEHVAELVAEIDQVLVDLSHLIECNDLLGVVSDGHNERQSVALVEKALNLVPLAITIEVEHGLQLGKPDIGEEILALLQDSNGKSLLDERSVFFQVRHDFDGLAQGFAALL